LYILAGSALQVTLPAVCAVTFLRQGQPASFAVALFWTGESITDVAVYMADAKKQTLPLLGGEGVTHDWNYLLAQLHLLGAAEFLGRLTWLLGVGVIVAAILLPPNESRRCDKGGKLAWPPSFWWAGMTDRGAFLRRLPDAPAPCSSSGPRRPEPEGGPVTDEGVLSVLAGPPLAPSSSRAITSLFRPILGPYLPARELSARMNPILSPRMGC